MDDDLLDVSVLSYEDTELIITLFYFDIVELGISSTLLLQRVATIVLHRTTESEIRRNKNQYINKIYLNVNDQIYSRYKRKQRKSKYILKLT
jgi:hypothetical protein